MHAFSKTGMGAPALAPPTDPATAYDPRELWVFKTSLAEAEGSDVFDCGCREDGSPRVEIQRIDSSEAGDPVFADDSDAWRSVVTRARAGLALHQRALQMIDPIERMLIEASFGWWPEPPGSAHPRNDQTSRCLVSICFGPQFQDAGSDRFVLPPAVRDSLHDYELSLANGNGIAILLALGLPPEPMGGPIAIDAFAGLVTAALRRHLGHRSPEILPHAETGAVRATIIHLGRREGYVEERLGDLARLVQRCRAIGATHIRWS